MMKKSVYMALIGGAAAQTLKLSGITFDKTLPCSRCIRGGYTYVYAKGSSTATEHIRDVSNSGDDYNGNCALKKFDGTYTYDMTTVVDLSK